MLDGQTPEAPQCCGKTATAAKHQTKIHEDRSYSWGVLVTVKKKTPFICFVLVLEAYSRWTLAVSDKLFLPHWWSSLTSKL